MTDAALEAAIEQAWERRAELSAATKGADRDAVEAALDLLDAGKARVAEPKDGQWIVHQWLKKAVLLSFRLNDMSVIPGGPGGANWWDKVPSKFEGWGEDRFREAGFRAVPGSIVRRSAYIAPNVVLMPSFVNLGAHVGEGTMVDTWATVGSCAQIGARVHLSGGVGIGGVLEPLQAGPVVIEDDCFVGARSEVVEGVVVRKGSVLSMGVFISSTTKIVDRSTGEIFIGEVPAYSVVVPGLAAGQAFARRHARPVALLRRHRQAGGRADPLQDLDQRSAARLMRSARQCRVAPGQLSSVLSGGSMSENSNFSARPGAVSGDARAMMMFEANKRSMTAAYLLWFFLGQFGGYRFYNGKTGSAVAILLLSIFGIILLAAYAARTPAPDPGLDLGPGGCFPDPGWIRNHNNLLAHQLAVG